MIVTHRFQIGKNDSRWYYGFYVGVQLYVLYCIENNKKYIECILIPDSAINNNEFYIEEMNNVI